MVNGIDSVKEQANGMKQKAASCRITVSAITASSYSPLRISLLFENSILNSESITKANAGWQSILIRAVHKMHITFPQVYITVYLIITSLISRVDMVTSSILLSLSPYRCIQEEVQSLFNIPSSILTIRSSRFLLYLSSPCIFLYSINHP